MKNVMEMARALAAQCWCDDETSSIEMDSRLAEAFARRLEPYLAKSLPASEELEAHYADNTAFRRVMFDVLIERQNQDKKWGVQNHGPFIWLGILGEEFGEVCEAALEHKFGGYRNVDKLRAEAIQVAAVAVALVQCIDRSLGHR